jgi:hypothetical protein
MSITDVNNLQNQILEIIQTLSPEQQQEVLNFAQSLPEKSRFQNWDRISEEEAQALQNEFTQEDISFSESILPDYLSQLEQSE